MIAVELRASLVLYLVMIAASLMTPIVRLTVFGTPLYISAYQIEWDFFQTFVVLLLLRST